MDYSELTYITLSKTKLDREVPNGSDYLNHVSTFTNMVDGLKEYLNAISMVDTKYFLLWDDDDPIPTVNLLPTDSGLVYGDMHVSDAGKLKSRPTRIWNRVDHLVNPYLLHRAIVRTECVRAIQPYLPQLGSQFEYLYHYLIADIFGSVYDKDFISIWARRELGMHNMANPTSGSTSKFLRENRDIIKERVLNR